MTQSDDDALKVIQSKAEGVLQSDLWKILDVDSRKCSRIVKKLLDSGMIERIEFRKDGIKTFVLKAKRRPVDPNQLLAGEELIPCIGCDMECVVIECPRLLDWMYQLALCGGGEYPGLFLRILFLRIYVPIVSFSSHSPGCPLLPGRILHPYRRNPTGNVIPSLYAPLSITKERIKYPILLFPESIIVRKKEKYP